PWGEVPYTLQLGDPSTIAERTGITVVADLRRRDVAAGGHGAPLLPGLHAALLHVAGEDRAVLNLGGIANLTLLPATGPVRGFDTGSANALMDAWCLRHLGHAYDRDGAFAASGRVDEALLARLLADDWFALPPPKSRPVSPRSARAPWPMRCGPPSRAPRGCWPAGAACTTRC